MKKGEFESRPQLLRDYFAESVRKRDILLYMDKELSQCGRSENMYRGLY